MLLKTYHKLLDVFGSQNWWPMEGGFEPKEWEVCLGAILTQNTNWKNVERALENLKKRNIISPLDIIKIGKEKLAGLIKPSGYYNQKAIRLKGFADFVLGFGGFRQFSKGVSREDLLKVRGIGPETCDSILLYALGRPYFVVDAYTRRVFFRLGILKEPESLTAKNNRKKPSSGNLDYEKIRMFFEKEIPKDTSLYREYHALIVELGKRFCRNEPLCRGCPLKKICKFR